jgi:hypothetical protein
MAAAVRYADDRACCMWLHCGCAAENFYMAMLVASACAVTYVVVVLRRAILCLIVSCLQAESLSAVKVWHDCPFSSWLPCTTLTYTLLLAYSLATDLHSQFQVLH